MADVKLKDDEKYVMHGWGKIPINVTKGEGALFYDDTGKEYVDMLSQTAGYAIVALSCLNERGDAWTLAKDIAECTGIPRPYLSKIFHKLENSGLI